MSGKSAGARAVGVTTLRHLARDAEFWKAARTDAAGGWFTERTGIERATCRDRADLVGRLAAGEVPETDLPLARLVEEAVRAAGPGRFDKPYYTASRPGDVLLTVPTAGGGRTPCRVLVPPGLDPAKPVPVVVALHGMGGSENLYFEGYGAGCVAKACARRGWVLVGPRSGGGFFGGAPPVAEIVAKLSERYPLDPKRVFLVGHSLGAAQAIDLVQQKPGFYAAVAVLGGGGRVRTPGAFATLPTFVGAGSEDIGLGRATDFCKTLTDAKVERVTFRTYPGVEHTVVVRAAVADVFGVFDAATR